LPAGSRSPPLREWSDQQHRKPERHIDVTILASAAVMVLGLLALWAWLRPRSTAAIVDAMDRPLAGSIASLERVQLGGVEQGLLIRGHDVANPVLLYLHGGPGTSGLGMVRTHNLPVLEKHYTVAVWDQRGAGCCLTRRTSRSPG
jgi:hypothetical protein